MASIVAEVCPICEQSKARDELICHTCGHKERGIFTPEGPYTYRDVFAAPTAVIRRCPKCGEKTIEIIDVNGKSWVPGETLDLIMDREEEEEAQARKHEDKLDEDGYIIPSGRIPHDEEDGWFKLPPQNVPIYAGIRSTCRRYREEEAAHTTIPDVDATVSPNDTITREGNADERPNAEEFEMRTYRGSSKKLAYINITLGKVNEVPTARATVVQRKMVTLLKSGTQKPFYKNILTVDFTIADINEPLTDFNKLAPIQKQQLHMDWQGDGQESRYPASANTVEEYFEQTKQYYGFKRWGAKSSNYSRLNTHMRSVVKGELEKKTVCRMCDRGHIWIKKGNNGSYVANWYHPQGLNGEQLCDRCYDWLHPVRGEFNPAPERDREEDDYPASKDNIFSDAVTELKTATRESMLEDIEFFAALDMQETRKFLGTGTSDCIDEERQHALSFGTTPEEAEEVYASCRGV